MNNLAIMYSGGLDSLIMYNYAKAQGIYDNITRGGLDRVVSIPTCHASNPCST